MSDSSAIDFSDYVTSRSRSLPSGRERFVLDRRGYSQDTFTVSSSELLEQVAIDPAICHGQPCIKGTRVLVTVILDALAGGSSAEEIVEEFPSLTTEGVQAAAAYGAWLAKQ